FTAAVRERARLVGAVVEPVDQPVAVLVGIRAAAVVGRARDVHAPILRVEHAVAVVVGIRAAVLVLEAVPVFGLVRALVVRVVDAVAVGIRHLELRDRSGCHGLGLRRRR